MKLGLVRSLPLLVVAATGCIDGVTQVAGTGAVYATRCSADMEVKGVEYFARCEPPSCAPRFESESVSHVVVALDPGRKVVGYAERMCVQDLSQASAIFQPELAPEPPKAEAAEPAEPAEEASP